ncbi:NH(3)-dependent NAD(+) synthetase [Candidatus Desulfarcum epimagneticum]|uniref:NH(3)-dependent NAD(+) synthetase n=1 Tax=uncultured Desulfobacteraceae bacterium TaxID=218296 RepID=A0A484HG49_9BACT|nr:NH(3)-dependent NAD(+) synthetase [uncultured Desulfobacteraceae bacterium]
MDQKKANEVIAGIRRLLGDYFKKNGLTYAVFGKSEGLDSSVIAGLLSGVKGIRPIGVIMPCESDPDAERVGRLVLDHFNIPHIRLDLTREFHGVMGLFYSADGLYGQLCEILKGCGDIDAARGLSHKKSIAAGNIKARLRMITLYHIASLVGGLVVSTDNLSELHMGFWTLNGDVGDIAPIQHVFKGIEEYDIAEALGVPEESLNAVPTDGLDVTPGGVDEDQLGMPYPDIDRVIIGLIRSRFCEKDRFKEEEIPALAQKLSREIGYQPDEIAHVAERMLKTDYKRHWPRVFQRDEIGLTEIEKMKI